MRAMPFMFSYCVKFCTMLCSCVQILLLALGDHESKKLLLQVSHGEPPEHGHDDLEGYGNAHQKACSVRWHTGGIAGLILHQLTQM